MMIYSGITVHKKKRTRFKIEFFTMVLKLKYYNKTNKFYTDFKMIYCNFWKLVRLKYSLNIVNTYKQM